MSVAPTIEQRKGISTARKAFMSSVCPVNELSYIKEPITPLIPPTYIIPGIPRLR